MPRNIAVFPYEDKTDLGPYDIEYKHGLRCDGVATSVINSINTIAVGLSIGIFNLLIRGYIQPEFDTAENAFKFSVKNLDKLTNTII